MDKWQNVALSRAREIAARRGARHRTPLLICGLQVRTSAAAAHELATLRDILVRGGLNSSALLWVPDLALPYREHVMVVLWQSRVSRKTDPLNATLQILKNSTSYLRTLETTAAASYDPHTDTLTYCLM
jgi:hypothetical protein